MQYNYSCMRIANNMYYVQTNLHTQHCVSALRCWDKNRPIEHWKWRPYTGPLMIKWEKWPTQLQTKSFLHSSRDMTMCCQPVIDTQAACPTLWIFLLTQPAESNPAYCIYHAQVMKSPAKCSRKPISFQSPGCQWACAFKIKNIMVLLHYKRSTWTTYGCFRWLMCSWPSNYNPYITGMKV